MSKDQDFYKNIIDNLYDGVYFVDLDRVITYWNKGAERITGYASQQVVGRSCRDNILNHVNLKGQQLCLSHCPLAACMQDGIPREADVFLHHADGHRVPVLVRAAPLLDGGGNMIGSVETFTRDTGVMGVHQELYELRHTVIKDKLTGVWNRRYLDACLRAAVAEMAPLKGLLTGLLFIDIDHFKQINDNHGHASGDRVLKMVAATMQNNLRKNDVMGRWGGDEFLVILNDLVTRDALKFIAKKIRMLVANSRLDLPSFSLTTTISVGATILVPDDSIETVVNRADKLMYKSKKAGSNRISIG
jgi:diguanylate cyclase (GGDEF)-like protein/PAS domain S-box-containing protein